MSMQTSQTVLKHMRHANTLYRQLHTLSRACQPAYKMQQQRPFVPFAERAFFNRKSKAADIHQEVEKAAKEAAEKKEEQEAQPQAQEETKQEPEAQTAEKAQEKEESAAAENAEKKEDSEQVAAEEESLSAEDVKKIKELFNEQEVEIESMKKQIDEFKAQIKDHEKEMKAVRIEYTKQVHENEATVKRYRQLINDEKQFAISKFAKDLLEVRDAIRLALENTSKTAA